MFLKWVGILSSTACTFNPETVRIFIKKNVSEKAREYLLHFFTVPGLLQVHCLQVNECSQLLFEKERRNPSCEKAHFWWFLPARCCSICREELKTRLQGAQRGGSASRRAAFFAAGPLSFG
jgi:hypothetical protein